MPTVGIRGIFGSEATKRVEESPVAGRDIVIVTGGILRADIRGE